MTLQPDSLHRRHDTLLVAANAAGDLSGQEAAAATTQIAGCPDCATLDADLRALAASVRTLPAAAHAPRDYRLTAEQAARLRGGSWWRRAARALSAPRGVGRPFATAFTTLGLVGLLLGSLPAGALPLFSGGSSGARLSAESAQSAEPSKAPEANPTDARGMFGPAVEGSPAHYGDETDKGDDAGTIGAGAGAPSDAPGVSEAPPAAPDLTFSDRQSLSQVSPLIALSSLFLLIGLSLFALRRLARRLA